MINRKAYERLIETVYETCDKYHIYTKEMFMFLYENWKYSEFEAFDDYVERYEEYRLDNLNTN